MKEDFIYQTHIFISGLAKASLSVVYKVVETYYVFDINLIDLLEELRLIEYNDV